MAKRAAPPFIVSVQTHIAAPSERIYRIIADYCHGHPLLMPGQFSNLTVLLGGIGGGTRISFQHEDARSLPALQADITEPEPGRVLAEHQRSTPPSVTSFSSSPSRIRPSPHQHLNARHDSHGNDAADRMVGRRPSVS